MVLVSVVKSLSLLHSILVMFWLWQRLKDVPSWQEQQQRWLVSLAINVYSIWRSYMKKK